MENGCLEREITSFPPGNVIPGYDRESMPSNPRRLWLTSRITPHPTANPKASASRSAHSAIRSGVKDCSTSIMLPYASVPWPIFNSLLFKTEFQRQFLKGPLVPAR